MTTDTQKKDTNVSSGVKRLNPECLLAAAKMAEPRLNWVIEFNSARAQIAPLNRSDGIVYFNPITSDSDHVALERALKKEEGWIFTYDTGLYLAWKDGADLAPAIGDESDTMLLLKCVAAMTGLELYV